MAPPIEPPPVAPPVALSPLALAPVEPPPVELLPLTCPACGGVFQVATTLAGCRVACPNCQALVVATPAAMLESPPAAPPEPPQLALPPIAIEDAPTKTSPSAPEQSPAMSLPKKDRSRRRTIRNLVLWAICLAILFAVLWLMS